MSLTETTKENTRGSTLIELLVAIVLLAISTVASARLLGTIRVSQHTAGQIRESLTRSRFIAELLLLGVPSEELADNDSDPVLSCSTSGQRCDINHERPPHTFTITVP